MQPKGLKTTTFLKCYSCTIKTQCYICVLPVPYGNFNFSFIKRIKTGQTTTDPSNKSSTAVEDAAGRHWHLGGGNEVVADDGREVGQVGLVELLEEIRHHERNEVLL